MSPVSSQMIASPRVARLGEAFLEGSARSRVTAMQTVRAVSLVSLGAVAFVSSDARQHRNVKTFETTIGNAEKNHSRKATATCSSASVTDRYSCTGKCITVKSLGELLSLDDTKSKKNDLMTISERKSVF